MLFLEENERLNTVAEMPDAPAENELLVTAGYTVIPMNARSQRKGVITLFHDVFFLQWITDRPMSEIKYVEYSLVREEGIGSILINLAKLSDFCRRYGWITYLKPESTRYKDEMLNKYFHITEVPEDASDCNTIYIGELFAVMLADPIRKSSAVIDKALFNNKFLEELKEYEEAVFRGRKMLGLLIRGTDYVVAGLPMRAYSTEQLIPIIREKMEKEQYEGIFLATEDADRLDEMLAAFPGKVIAVSQKRYRIRDFVQAITISEIEKENKSAEEHEMEVEDTTVNYFYAIYLLSRCAGFISTPFCNGTGLVLSFNQRFEFMEVLQNMVY